MHKEIELTPEEVRMYIERYEASKRRARQKYMRAYYKKNRDTILENNRRWQRNNPEAYKASQKRYNEKRKKSGTRDNPMV